MIEWPTPEVKTIIDTISMRDWIAMTYCLDIDEVGMHMAATWYNEFDHLGIRSEKCKGLK
eukprot:Awhi_evm1s14020